MCVCRHSGNAREKLCKRRDVNATGPIHNSFWLIVVDVIVRLLYILERPRDIKRFIFFVTVFFPSLSQFKTKSE